VFNKFFMREVRVSLVFFVRERQHCVFNLVFRSALMKYDILSCRVSEARHVVVAFQKRDI